MCEEKGDRVEMSGTSGLFSESDKKKGRVPSSGLTSTSSSVKLMTVRAFLTTFQSLLSLMEETLAHWPWRRGKASLAALAMGCSP